MHDVMGTKIKYDYVILNLQAFYDQHILHDKMQLIQLNSSSY